MCGIAVVFGYERRAPAVDARALERMSRRMECRGPDGNGAWINTSQNIALAHRRLAIIDLSDDAAQPMHSAEPGYTIAFNGEIYNYRELRAKLESSGHHLRTQSDTEVLLLLYAEKGAAMLHDLRGMFALAIWDARRNGLFLARDAFGIKPLYYADDGRTFRAASEVKALLAGGGIDMEADAAGHVGFHLWGHVPEPHTLYRGIRALPAGSWTWVDERGRGGPHQFANVSSLFVDSNDLASNSDVTQARADLRDAMLDTVRHHLVADVDVGVFLSAGLDSSTLAALATEISGRVRTVTLGFDEYRGTANDETPLAADVARHCGTDHETIWVTRNDFEDALPRILDRMDQPSIDGVNSYFVAWAAKQAGLKVALSGVGGDELFGGYPSFRQIPRLVRAVRRLPAARAVGRHVRVLAASLAGQLSSPKYAGVLEYGGDFGGGYLLRRGLFLPWELPRVMGDDFFRAGWEELATASELAYTTLGITNEHGRVAALEASWYMRNQLLRDTDWASMSHSVEVRVPLVDWTLWRRVIPLLPSLAGPLKLAMANTPRIALPAAVLQRSKTGFGVPTREWMQRHAPTVRHARGLRGWARYVYQQVAPAA